MSAPMITFTGALGLDTLSLYRTEKRCSSIDGKISSANTFAHDFSNVFPPIRPFAWTRPYGLFGKIMPVVSAVRKHRRKRRKHKRYYIAYSDKKTSRSCCGTFFVPGDAPERFGSVIDTCNFMQNRYINFIVFVRTDYFRSEWSGRRQAYSVL